MSRSMGVVVVVREWGWVVVDMNDLDWFGMGEDGKKRKKKKDRGTDCLELSSFPRSLGC